MACHRTLEFCALPILLALGFLSSDGTEFLVQFTCLSEVIKDKALFQAASI